MATITIQPDAETGIDALGYKNGPNTNYGTNQSIYFGGIGNEECFSALKFNLSPLSGKTIVSASLVIYCSYARSGTNSLVVYRMLSGNSDWDETMTWNIRKTGTNWAGSAGCNTPNTDYSSTLMGSLTTNNNPQVNDEWSVALDVGEFSSMVANNSGLIIRGANTTTCPQWTAFSSDYTSASYRPKLVVEYTDAAVSTFLQKVVFF